jgi:hypothetical protein
MEENQNYLLLRIEALETENKRLNDELKGVKYNALKIQLSDPNFDKPLSELNVNYEIIKP